MSQPTAGQGAMLLDMATRKNAAAVKLGKLRAQKAAPGELAALGAANASKGGKARNKKLTKEQRSAIARKAAEARWDNK